MSDNSAIDAAIAAAGISVSAVFVPFSQSRNKAEKQPSLNYRVTVQRNGRDVLTTDYTMGCGNCPAYHLSVKEAGVRNSIMRDEMIREECETGHAYRHFGKGAAILPDTRDVLHSIICDAEVIDYAKFEDWAEEYGFNADSRKAEAIYRACLAHTLALRAAIGDDNLRSLRDAFSEY